MVKTQIFTGLEVLTQAGLRSQVVICQTLGQQGARGIGIGPGNSGANRTKDLSAVATPFGVKADLGKPVHLNSAGVIGAGSNAARIGIEPALSYAQDQFGTALGATLIPGMARKLQLVAQFVNPASGNVTGSNLPDTDFLHGAYANPGRIDNAIVPNPAVSGGWLLTFDADTTRKVVRR